jgi:hypothetical protein
MKTYQLALGIAVVSLVGSGVVTADPSTEAVGGKKKDNAHEKLVFVTGSRIPRRIEVKSIGTNTTSPIRVYTREEMDKIGRFTTEGVLAQDPSVRIIGLGAHGPGMP